MDVKSVHHSPCSHAPVPVIPSLWSAPLLGEKISKGPRGLIAPTGSMTRLSTYSAMHATVMSCVGLPVRKIRRKISVSPHMPGRRRPQMRHSSASARVNLPHDGQRIVRVGLPNIVRRLARNDVAFVEPDAEVNQATGE